MIDFTTLTLGDFYKIRYETGERMRGGTIQGPLTRIWTPEEHRAGHWQGQINNGWCFHEEDTVVEHREPTP